MIDEGNPLTPLFDTVDKLRELLLWKLDTGGTARGETVPLP